MSEPRFSALPSSDDRRLWLAHLEDANAHRDIVRGLACLYETDVELAPRPSAATGWLRVAVWNIERGRDPVEIARLIGSSGADAALLSEVDLGMGRTSNRDVAREIGSSLSFGSVFGIEFIELGLGKAADLARAEADENLYALHGNAIIGRVPLERPEVVRMDESGAWFTESRGEPRVGGRCAVVATTVLDGTPVDVVAVHLESHSDTGVRAEQMRMLLEHLDVRGTEHTIIGGDLNTFSAPLLELADRSNVQRMRAADPSRFSWPAPYEPLFDVSAEHGFEWVDANLAAPTTYHDAMALPDHVPIKLDWVLVRGLEAWRPVVISANGLSDHEMLAVSVRLPNGGH